MKIKKICRLMFNFKSTFIILLFLIMITNPVLTTAGAAKGLLLWFNSIIPSLLPMLIITNIIINYYGESFKNPDLYIIVLGLFCGYPMGASAIAGFEKNSGSSMSCNTKKQQLLLAACNISSPSFVLNYIYASSLEPTLSIASFLFAVYSPTIVFIAVKYVSDFLHTDKKYKVKNSYGKNLSGNKYENKCIHERSALSVQPSFIKVLDASIMNSFETITKLGGYIILFSIFAIYITSLPIHNLLIKSALTGALEITTGIDYVKNTALPSDLKTLFILIINAFGGISCAAQTNSVISQTGYSIKKYIYHKIVIAAVTGIAGYFMIYVF